MLAERFLTKRGERWLQLAVLKVLQGTSLVVAAEAVCNNEGHIVAQAVLMSECCLCMIEARSEASETGHVSSRHSSGCIHLKDVVFV